MKQHLRRWIWTERIHQMTLHLLVVAECSQYWDKSVCFIEEPYLRSRIGPLLIMDKRHIDSIWTMLVVLLAVVFVRPRKRMLKASLRGKWCAWVCGNWDVWPRDWREKREVRMKTLKFDRLLAVALVVRATADGEFLFHSAMYLHHRQDLFSRSASQLSHPSVFLEQLYEPT
jgi:hypothetical protein